MLICELKAAHMQRTWPPSQTIIVPVLQHCLSPGHRGKTLPVMDFLCLITYITYLCTCVNNYAHHACTPNFGHLALSVTTLRQVANGQHQNGGMRSKSKYQSRPPLKPPKPSLRGEEKQPKIQSQHAAPASGFCQRSQSPGNGHKKKDLH